MWFLGHSLYFWLGKWIQQSNTVLPFMALWLGFRGARIHTLESALGRLSKKTPPPDYICIQAGSNDLVTMPAGQIRRSLIDLLAHLQTVFPRSVIIWSNILPRQIYSGARN